MPTADDTAYDRLQIAEKRKPTNIKYPESLKTTQAVRMVFSHYHSSFGEEMFVRSSKQMLLTHGCRLRLAVGVNCTTWLTAELHAPSFLWCQCQLNCLLEIHCCCSAEWLGTVYYSISLCDTHSCLRAVVSTTPSGI